MLEYDLEVSLQVNFFAGSSKIVSLYQRFRRHLGLHLSGHISLCKTLPLQMQVRLRFYDVVCFIREYFPRSSSAIECCQNALNDTEHQ